MSIIADVLKKVGKTSREIEANDITDRLILRMIGEPVYVLQEQIAQRESDIDVAMVLGAGFPDLRGGLLKYAFDLSVDEVIRRLESLAERFGDRFRPCEFLKGKTGV